MRAVLAIGNVDHAVIRDAQRMDDAEVRRPLTGREGLRRHHLTVVIVHGLVAERAPHALERAGVRIEHDHAVIAVAIGDVQLVRRLMDPDVSGAMHVARVGVALLALLSPMRIASLPSPVSFRIWIVIDRLQFGDAVGGAVVAGDRHKAFRVDVDAVLTLGPLRAGVLTAPALDERAGGVEHHHRRRGRRRLAWLQRARAMQQPDVVLAVDREARGVAKLPLRRYLRPRLVHLELGKVAAFSMARRRRPAADSLIRPRR